MAEILRSSTLDRSVRIPIPCVYGSGQSNQEIEQINKAVAEMDNVVQKNAANAEESAAASEEINAQAE
jgi:hypothetical protein